MDFIKMLESQIKAQSLELERRIKDGKVYIDSFGGNRYYLTSLEEYIELKSYGEIIKGTFDEWYKWEAN